MSIEKCRKEHLDQVVDIENKSFKQPYHREVFRGFLGSPLFLVALSDDKVIGYAIGTPRGLIVSIAVLPEHCRKGVGKMLLEELISSMNSKEITLTLRIENEDAHEFYKAMGFKYGGTIHRYYEDGEDAIMMVKYR